MNIQGLKSSYCSYILLGSPKGQNLSSCSKLRYKILDKKSHHRYNDDISVHKTITEGSNLYAEAYSDVKRKESHISNLRIRIREFNTDYDAATIINDGKR